MKRDHFDFRIDGFQGGPRGFHLDGADAFGAVEDLALQVGEVDLVRIGDGEPAEAARRKVERRRAAEAAGADDQRARRTQPLLPLDPDFGQKDVAAVAEELLVLQFDGLILFSATGGGGGVFTTGWPLR